MRVVHLLRPAQGGMLRQVRALMTDPAVDGLLAAPPETLARWGEPLRAAPLPLPATDSLKAQLVGGLAAGRWARRVGAELLHGHGLARTPLYAIAALRSGLPLVVTLHNLVGPLSSAQRGALRWALGRARRVIVVSDAVGRSAEGVVAAGRLRRVYNGVDLARFQSLPDRAEARRRLGWEAEGVVALCVARLSPEKGLDTLANPPVRLVVAGDGPERERLAALPGDIVWLGERDDVPLLMAASDLYVQPSRQEGLGLAVIEAQAAGLPVVATRVGGLPEAVADGVTGVLVDDPAGLRPAIATLAGDADARARLGAAGRERVAREFTVDAMREATRAVYAEALP